MVDEKAGKKEDLSKKMKYSCICVIFFIILQPIMYFGVICEKRKGEKPKVEGGKWKGGKVKG